MSNTPWRTFAGANICGNPKMPTAWVTADLRTIFAEADIAALQEFHWRSYWWALRQFTNGATAYDTAPSITRGLASPTFAGQVIITKRGTGRITRQWSRLLHKGIGGISESRWLRAAKVMSDGGHACIYGTTHNVVGGDEAGDGDKRQEMLRTDLDRLEAFLDFLLAEGLPVVYELDANIHPGTSAWRRLHTIVSSRGGTFVGQLGVEYLFWFQGRRTLLEPHPSRAADTIPTSRLKTDHEVRLFRHRLCSPKETR